MRGDPGRDDPFAVEPEPRRFEPWPLGLAALLLCVMLVISGFAWIAGSHPDALVVDDAYEAGRRINETLRAERAARALGLDLDVALTLESPDAVGVRVAARGPDGAAVLPDSVRVVRERPAEGLLDAEFALEAAPDGHRGTVPLPRAGRWRLVVTAVVQGHPLRETHGLDVPMPSAPRDAAGG